jgi:hypothetical protein
MAASGKWARSRVYRHARLRALLARGDEVVGVDNLNDYYDVASRKPAWRA